MKRPLIPTCSLCTNFDPNRSLCKVNGEHRIAISTEHAHQCQNFVRDINVIPDVCNFYRLDEEIPGDWEMDLRNIPKDSRGNPLIVYTNRGVERALPANETVQLKGDRFFGVPRILTYQGQREIIYELGVDDARKEAERAGVELTVLPEEEGCTGVVKVTSIKQNRSGMDDGYLDG